MRSIRNFFVKCFQSSESSGKRENPELKSNKNQKPPVQKIKHPSAIKAEDGTSVKLEKMKFASWGGTFQSSPGITGFPESAEGVKASVAYAKRNRMKVTTTAYGHSWEQGPDDGAFSVAMLSEKETASMPAHYLSLAEAAKKELCHVVNLKQTVEEDGKTYHLFDLGPSVTNHQLRELGNKLFMQGEDAFGLQVGVVMTENSLAGMVSNGCHGAGWQNKTVADYVESITFVNAKAEFQTITRQDPEWRSAFLAYGMLGPIVNIRMRLVKMPAINLSLEKIPVGLQVPPPKDYKAPDYLTQHIKLPTDEKEIAQAKQNMLKRVYSTSHYEDFVFPGQTEGYSVSYTEDGDAKEAEVFPPKLEGKLNIVGEDIAQEMTSSPIFKALPTKLQEGILSDFAQFILHVTEEKPFVTAKVNGIHFRGDGVQDFKASDYEMEIGIPKLDPNSPAIKDNLNLEIVAELYWAQLEIYYRYAYTGEYPQLLPLELRINGGSNMTLSVQRGNVATCAIEILSLEESLLPKDMWHTYVQETIDRWKEIADTYKVQFFPHLAKQFSGRTVMHNGQRIEMGEYVKTLFEPRVVEFYRDCQSIARKGGYTLDDMEMFRSNFFDKLFPLTPAVRAELAKEVKAAAASDEKSNGAVKLNGAEFPRRNSPAQLQTLLSALSAGDQKGADVSNESKVNDTSTSTSTSTPPTPPTPPPLTPKVQTEPEKEVKAVASHKELNGAAVSNESKVNDASTSPPLTSEVPAEPAKEVEVAVSDEKSNGAASPRRNSSAQLHVLLNVDVSNESEVADLPTPKFYMGDDEASTVNASTTLWQPAPSSVLPGDELSSASQPRRMSNSAAS